MNRARRPYEIVALAAAREVRQIGWYWARRCRKSTGLGNLFFDEMSREPGRMCVAASASLLLGSELVNVTLSAVEQADALRQESAEMNAILASGASEQNLLLGYADHETNKELKGLTPEDIASLYKSSRLEFRLHFDRTAYSRLQIIAPSPATARSWRALVGRDECGYTAPAFEMALRVATDAMVRDTPDLKIVYASNLSASDHHPWFTTTLPRELTEGSEDEQFPPNPNGHLYVGQHGILIHRVALQDAYAAGHFLYDDRGKKMTYDECRAHPQVKMGWDVSYALNHKSGGASAIDLFALLTAQQRGSEPGFKRCTFAFVDDAVEFQRALRDLRANLRGGLVAVGYDPATTTKETSNPSCVTVTEKIGTDRFQRLVVMWKEKKPQIVRERLRQIFEAIKARPEGGAARRFCILATSERYFAEETADILRAVVPTELVIESVSLQPPGYDDPVNFKTYIADIYAAAVNDNHYSMPGGEYFKNDQRQTTKNAGKYECTPDADGAHGDSFASGGAAEYGLAATGGAITAETLPQIRTGGPMAALRKFLPRRLAA